MPQQQLPHYVNSGAPGQTLSRIRTYPALVSIGEIRREAALERACLGSCDSRLSAGQALAGQPRRSGGAQIVAADVLPARRAANDEVGGEAARYDPERCV
ncbi:hypothetical protein [Burkholderia sp. 3C]